MHTPVDMLVAQAVVVVVVVHVASLQEMSLTTFDIAG